MRVIAFITKCTENLVVFFEGMGTEFNEQRNVKCSTVTDRIFGQSVSCLGAQINYKIVVSKTEGRSFSSYDTAQVS
jgi:hypothetical protein